MDKLDSKDAAAQEDSESAYSDESEGESGN